jgi:hypothetical protein
MEFKIPTEKSVRAGRFTPAYIDEILERRVQLPYSAQAVKEGAYRDWITRVDSDTLHMFIKHNEETMENILKVKVLGPNEKEFVQRLYRNCLYTTELHLRENEETDRLDEDLFSYHKQWMGKFERRREEALGTKGHDTAINPYY